MPRRLRVVMRVNVLDEQGDEEFLNLITETIDVVEEFGVTRSAELAMHSLSLKMQEQVEAQYGG